MANRGRDTYRKTLDAVKDPNKRDTGPNSISPQQWRTERNPKQLLPYAPELILNSLNLQSHEGTFIEVKNTAIGDWINPPNSLYYENLYSGAASMIIATLNVGINDNRQRAPNRWSEVALNFWRARDITGNSDLKYVLQQFITNSESTDVIEELIPEAEFLGTEKHNCIDYTPRDGDRFFALLQTPNVVGTAYMM